MRTGLIIALMLGSCDWPSVADAAVPEQGSKQAEAAKIADYLCGWGDAELISGRKGLVPEDYRCATAEIPSNYTCNMENGTTIRVAILTDMSGEVEDRAAKLQLRYPDFQSNNRQVLATGPLSTHPYMYSLDLRDLRLIRAHIHASEPEPLLHGRCLRK